MTQSRKSSLEADNICNGTHSLAFSELENVLGIKAGETTPDGEYTLLTVACMGACALAPSVMIDEEVYAKMTPKRVREVLGEYKSGA